MPSSNLNQFNFNNMYWTFIQILFYHVKGFCHTSINLKYMFIQRLIFPCNFLLSFIDILKIGISNKP
ncbi:hypothetical protein C6359_28110 [Bacillus wiedmannii]|nr:hypothetical protein C6358_28075 [Bacillus wiedmannii]PRT39367.1 hypothetical protein C6359_28110 [Bacillus wiedmannii]